jgi:hypothetical protein
VRYKERMNAIVRLNKIEAGRNGSAATFPGTYSARAGETNTSGGKQTTTKGKIK